MELPAILQNEIIEFLQSLPNIGTVNERKAFIVSAALDRRLQDQVPFNEVPAQFIPLLVSTLLAYGQLSDGRDALGSVLEAAKGFIGTDKQELCDILLRKYFDYRLRISQEAHKSNLKEFFQTLSERWHIFISYVPEDRENIVEPLAQSLQNEGLCICYEHFKLIPGYCPVFLIDLGLQRAWRGVVILSPNFFRKRWSEGELKEFKKLLEREERTGKLIFLIWGNAEDSNNQMYDEETCEKNAKYFSRLAENFEITIINSTEEAMQQILQFEFEPASIDVNGTIVHEKRRTAKHFIEELGNNAWLELVAIPGGTFFMGASESEIDSSPNEQPQHEVNIAPFYMGKYPVTQEQWRAVYPTEPDSPIKRVPQREVSWDEANEFCKKLSKITGKIYRLPTEAEWEYACRAGTTTPFSFGETISPGLANYDGRKEYTSVKGLKLTETSFTKLKQESEVIPIHVWKKLQSLRDKEFTTQKAFCEAIEIVIDGKIPNKHKVSPNFAILLREHHLIKHMGRLFLWKRDAVYQKCILKHAERIFKTPAVKHIDDAIRFSGQPRAVGSFPPNAFGLYDMHGNVCEWCADEWHDNYKKAPSDGSAWKKRGELNYRVLRGGNWFSHPEELRCAYRKKELHDTKNIHLGFRVVCECKPPKKTISAKFLEKLLMRIYSKDDGIGKFLKRMWVTFLQYIARETQPSYPHRPIDIQPPYPHRVIIKVFRREIQVDILSLWGIVLVLLILLIIFIMLLWF